MGFDVIFVLCRYIFCSLYRTLIHMYYFWLIYIYPVIFSLSARLLSVNHEHTFPIEKMPTYTEYQYMRIFIVGPLIHICKNWNIHRIGWWDDMLRIQTKIHYHFLDIVRVSWAAQHLESLTFLKIIPRRWTFMMDEWIILKKVRPKI